MGATGRKNYDLRTMKLSGYFYLILFISNFASAQVLEDKTYDENTQTVLLYNSKVEQSLPVITLNNNETLTLLFDQLDANYQNFNYRIIHCNADWTPSNLSNIEYLEGFTDNYITNYKFSFNTKQAYINYTLLFPNNDVKILLSGNYYLEVFPSADAEHPIFGKRFYVVDNKVTIAHFLDRSSIVNDRNKKQKINFDLLYSNLRVENPMGQFKIHVMQNQRVDNSKINIKPTYFENGKLVYNHVDANVFDGLNEYRRMDIRTVRFLGEHVAKIDLSEGNNMYLLTDYPKNIDRYNTDLDINGNFKIRRIDGLNSNIEADYIQTHFSFDYGAQNPFGAYYVLGKFNNWSANDASKLTYNLNTRKYEATLLLKQGVYNYQYGFKANNATTLDIASVEGSFFETENDYTFLVYFRKTGNRYDELIAYKEINTIR